ncbi:NUDIX hydrolase [Paenibacillus silvisoli]|uniref:NUDIX hydrolase n=1 Tax=Paenibacillus silvisoli TaxID=3110539 RepID=UPI002804D99C|nr:NUDIX hydrolase [Paenibacillus silvisoli]
MAKIVGSTAACAREVSGLDEVERWHRHFGVYGICLDGGVKLLVVRKGKGPYAGRYDLPGGTVEEGEPLTAALMREFVEEAGIEVEALRQIGLCDYLVPYPLVKRGTTHIHHVAAFYEARPLAGVEMPSDSPPQFEQQDSLGAVWVSVEELSDSNCSPLVMQAVDWIGGKAWPLDCRRLDNWTVLRK